MTTNGRPPAAVSDDEGIEISHTNSHLWKAPLNNYILERHAERQRLEIDFEKNERSRQFITAARVVDMSSTRIVEMEQRRKRIESDSRMEAEYNSIREEQDQRRAQYDDVTRMTKEREREVRLEKQRGEAAKKRGEDKAKKERDEEKKRIKAETVRLAKAQEVQRRASLSPAERAAEDAIIADKLQRDREELAAQAALKTLNADGSENQDGRGARKRRKKTFAYGDEEEEESKLTTSPFGGNRGETDELEDAPTYAIPFDYDAMSSGLSSARSETDDDDDVDMHNASDDRKDLTFDAAGNALTDTSTLTKSAKAKKPKLKDIAELEKKVWTQIARKEIPKVGHPPCCQRLAFNV